MKFFSLIFLSLFVSSCSASQDKNASTPDIDCDIYFDRLNNCSYKNADYHVTVKVISESLAEDEKLLKTLLVTTDKKEHTLSITPDTAILDGDTGYISFTDINFDGISDLAITTSFGTPNLYLDYWVFNPKNSSYIFVGNFPKFILNKKDKTLSATVKNSAENYETKKWKWENNNLKKTP